MSNFKEKAQVFIIGLAAGLLIVGAFFILKLDDYFKELSVYKKMSQTFSQVKPSQSAINLEENKEETKSVVPSTKTKAVVIPDSARKTIVSAESAEVNDTLHHSDSTILAANSEDIVVRKDELLSTKTLDVNNLNPVANKTSKDSLLQKVSGIKDDNFTGKQMFNLELWSSPLNYKGYKLSKYKIVLYGISSFDGMKLYKLDDVLYLRSASAIYRLDYAPDFKPYEYITDEQIINKLK